MMYCVPPEFFLKGVDHRMESEDAMYRELEEGEERLRVLDNMILQLLNKTDDPCRPKFEELLVQLRGARQLLKTQNDLKE